MFIDEVEHVAQSKTLKKIAPIKGAQAPRGGGSVEVEPKAQVCPFFLEGLNAIPKCLIGSKLTSTLLEKKLLSCPVVVVLSSNCFQILLLLLLIHNFFHYPSTATFLDNLFNTEHRIYLLLDIRLG